MTKTGLTRIAKGALFTAVLGLASTAGAADLVSVAAETGVVTFAPSALVTPILTTAAAGISAGVLGYLLWKGLSVIRRGIAKMGA
jgi:hypothetical protein